MTRREIILKRGEYQDVDEGVKALVSTVIAKLPEPSRKKYQAVEWQQRAMQKEAELLQDGIDGAALSSFLNGNAAQSATGRSWSVCYKLLLGVAELARDFGHAHVNAALSRIVEMQQYQKCTLPYLQAVLKNTVPLPSASPRADIRPAKSPAAPDATASMGEKWDRMSDMLAQRVNGPSFNTWIRPVRCVELTKDSLTLRVPSDTHRDWLLDNYTDLLCWAFRQVQGRIPDHLKIEPVEEAGA